MTSIIMLAYDLTQLSRQITALAIEAIVKYTDDYELILIDTVPVGCEILDLRDTFDVFQFNKRPDRIRIEQYLRDTDNPGQYASYNIGAKIAKGKYLCFMQNDVIVTEGWLEALKYYLDKGLSQSIQPSQFPKTREFMKSIKSMSDGELQKGTRDAGMIMMTREAFNKVGGWNEKYRMFNGERDMYERLAEKGLHNICTNKTQILHVNSATFYARSYIEPVEQAKDIKQSNYAKDN